MKTPGRLSAALLLALVIVYLGSGLSLGHYRVLDVKKMSHIPLEGLIGEIKGSDIVFIGEQHGVMEHHDAQLEIIKALRGSGARVALGLEMFMAEEQPSLDRWVAGEMPEAEFRKLYTDYWNLPWYLYEDIFLYARKERVPLIGLNVPKEITRKISNGGFASLTPEDLAKLPVGIACDVDEDYMKFIGTVNRAHGRSGRGFVNFCEAQLVWDKVMAHHVVEYLKRNPGTTVVVLSGLVHSWKKGIPRQVARESDYAYKVILPLTDDTARETMNPDYIDYFLD